MHQFETLSNWLLAAGFVLYGLGFVKKRQCEGNGDLVTVPDKSVFVFFWLFLFFGIIFVAKVMLV